MNNHFEEIFLDGASWWCVTIFELHYLILAVSQTLPVTGWFLHNSIADQKLVSGPTIMMLEKLGPQVFHRLTVECSRTKLFRTVVL